MKKIIVSFVRGTLNDQRGQILPWVAVVLVGLMGMAGVSIDVGRAYVVHSQLQNIANAAALAAAGNIYNTGSTDNAVTIATQYSAATGGENTNVGVGVATPTITQRCLNMLMPNNTGCPGAPNNAVQVKESASVPTYFMALFGFSHLDVSATALASKGAAQPWNVAVIVDSTGSMNVADSNCGSVTEFQCALNGVQALLGGTDPTCPTNPVTCPTGYDFQVALFTFPNVLTSYNGALPTVNGTSFDSQSLDINCGGTPGSYTNWKTQPLAAPYTLPKPGATLATDAKGRVYMTYTQTSTGNQWNASYQITPFLHDYYDPSNSSSGYLNTGSDIVKAAGYGSTKGCLTYTFGIDGASGTGSGFGNTSFASSIYEADAALALQKAANPNSQSAIIFLSDGQANASYFTKNSSAYGGSSPYYNGTNQYNRAIEFPDAPNTSTVGPTTSGYPVPVYYTPATVSNSALGYSVLGGNGTGYYPDWTDQCQQAVAAAQYVLNSNGSGATGNFVVNRFYAVAYGAETSGCSNGWSVGKTDTTNVLTGTLSVPVSGASILPCTTMENMAGSGGALSLMYFYSDNQQTGNVNSSCADTIHPTVALKDIFAAIAASMTTPRLLPANAH